MILRRRPRLAYLSLVAISLTALSACGVEDINASGGKKSHSDDAEPAAPVEGDEQAFDHIVTPPAAYYDALLAEAMESADKGLQLADTRATLWVNFDGANVEKGNGRGKSFIPCKANVTIPPADVSAAEREQILAMVQKHYDDTGAGLTVTPVKPVSGDFTTLHVGGSYSDLGCIGGRGILGVAPFDVGDRNKNDIGFAFTKGVGSARVIADTISHEAGHSYGLDHVVTRTDLMYASSGANITGFGVSKVSGSARTQDAPAILVQVLGNVPADGSAPTPVPAPVPAPAPASPIPGLPNIPGGLAGLPGLGQIGSIGSLLPGLAGVNIADISTLLPVVTNLLPGLAAGAIGIPGLDQILTVVGLASAAGAGQNGAPIPGLGALPIDPALAAGILDPANLASLGNLGNLAGLASLGGFANLPSAVTDLGSLFGGFLGQPAAGGSNLAPVPVVNQLPDLSVLLGLANGAGGANLADLVGNFTGSAQVVNANFQGAEADALLSLLKVAYAQARLNTPAP
jgi:hypothetical protein